MLKSLERSASWPACTTSTSGADDAARYKFGDVTRGVGFGAVRSEVEHVQGARSRCLH